jgi:hypothetical protein
LIRFGWQLFRRNLMRQFELEGPTTRRDQVSFRGSP